MNKNKSKQKLVGGKDIMASLYLKSDGNGGVVVGKGMIAFIGLIIVLLSSVVSVVAYSVGVRGDVDYNTEKITACYENIEDVQDDVTSYGKDIATIQTKIETVQDDISEMKGDIKELLKHSGGG